MTYDAARQQVIFFGGSAADSTNSGGSLYQTWALRGTRWTNLNPIHFPRILAFDSQITYDEDRQVVVLAGSPPLANEFETWTWDGKDWSQQHPSHSPPARDNLSLAYFPKGHKTVLFGGAAVRPYFFFYDTWTWDGIDWHQESPSESPPSKNEPGFDYLGRLTWDWFSQTVVLFVGQVGCRGCGYRELGNWQWDGQNWRHSDPSLSPPSSYLQILSPKSLGGMLTVSVDQSTQGIPVGQPGRNLQVFKWDGRAWITISSANPPDEASVEQFGVDHIAYDEAGDRLVLLTSSFTGPSRTLLWGPGNPQRGGTSAVTIDKDHNGLDDNLERSLAEKFAPVLLLEPDESNYPVNVDWMMQRATLGYREDGCTPDHIHQLPYPVGSQSQLVGAPWVHPDAFGAGHDLSGCSDSSAQRLAADDPYPDGPGKGHAEQTWYLDDLPDQQRVGSLDPRDWVTYVHEYPTRDGGVMIQYWHLFAYNQLSIDRHGGDWDASMQVQLDRHLNLKQIWLSRHLDDHPGTAFQPSEVSIYQGTHPVYVADGGGHAAYASPSDWCARPNTGTGNIHVATVAWTGNVDDPGSMRNVVSDGSCKLGDRHGGTIWKTWTSGEVSQAGDIAHPLIGSNPGRHGGLVMLGQCNPGVRQATQFLAGQCYPLADDHGNRQDFIRYSGLWGATGVLFGGWRGPMYQGLDAHGVYTSWYNQGAEAPAGAATPCRPRSDPAVVVVMVMGLNSSLPDQDAYNPLQETECTVSSLSKNAQLRQLGETFDKPGLGTADGKTLMTEIGKTGAVILPFSYSGAGFTSRNGQAPKFHANEYGNHVPNESEVIADARVLDSELESTRQQWPAAKIVIIGHSLGGLVAKQWWRNWDGTNGTGRHATAAWNVAGVYTLDAPINGGSGTAAYMDSPQRNCPVEDMLPCVVLSQEFAALWYDFALGQKDDYHMAQIDIQDRGVFTPTGTRGDLIMEILSGNYSNGQELGPQLLATFDDGGQIDQLLQPGRITPTDASATSWLDSHGVVYHDPDNIQFVVDGIKNAAALGSSPAANSFALAASRQFALPAGPTVSLAAPVMPGDHMLTLIGSGLGVAPGIVQIGRANQQASSSPCSIDSWSDSRITCQAATDVGSGFVAGATKAGAPFAAGWVVGLDGPGAVAHIAVDPVQEVSGGLAEKVKVTATDKNGAAVSGSLIHISDGITEGTATSDARGRATLGVEGSGISHLVVYSGQAWTPVNLAWMPPATMALSLDVDQTALSTRTSVPIRATLTDAQGRPAANVPVHLRAMGSKSTRIAHPDLVTDSGGMATTSVSSLDPDQAIIGAVSNGGFSRTTVRLAWSSQRSFWPWIIVGLGLALVLGLIVLVWKRFPARRAGRSFLLG